METFHNNPTDQNSQTGLRIQHRQSKLIKVRTPNVSRRQVDIQRKIENIIVDNIQCRICLQTANQGNDFCFINPCECTGTVRYIHKHCYQQWMKATLKRRNFNQLIRLENQGVECELCKMKIPVKVNLIDSLVSWQQFKQKVNNNMCQFILHILLLITVLGTLGFSILNIDSQTFNFASGQTSSGKNVSKVQRIILISGLFISIGAFIMLFVHIYQVYISSHKIQVKFKGKQLKTMKAILDPYED